MELRSKNFSQLELRCKCEVCRRKEQHHVDPDALAALQRVRERFGKGIVLTSAYRCRNHHAEMLKPKPGTHSLGTAFDISIGWGRDRFVLLQLFMEEGFNGLGFGSSFIHVDYKRAHGTTWGYSHD